MNQTHRFMGKRLPVVDIHCVGVDQVTVRIKMEHQLDAATTTVQQQRSSDVNISWQI